MQPTVSADTVMTLLLHCWSSSCASDQAVLKIFQDLSFVQTYKHCILSWACILSGGFQSLLLLSMLLPLTLASATNAAAHWTNVIV